MKQKTNVRIVRLDSTDDDVTLRIKVGTGHPSVTTVYRDGKKIRELKYPYNDEGMGKKRDLLSSDVLISTVVHDLPETPNDVLVYHTLSDKQQELIKSEFEILVDDGEVAICSTQTYFLKK